MRVAVLVRDAGEALDLVGWAARLAASRRGELLVLAVTRGTEPARREVDLTAEQDHPVLRQAREALGPARDRLAKVAARLLSDPRPEAAALAEVEAASPDLVVAGAGVIATGAAGAQEGRDVSWARLARDCAADLLVLRAAEEPRGETPARVLVATAGGPHARVALRLVDGLAREGGDVQASALIVCASQDEEACESSRRLLERALKEAGADPARVVPRVVSSERPAAAIAAAAAEIDLLLLGASDEGVVERLLLGHPVPDRVLATRPRAVGVGVVRAAPATGRRAVARLERKLGRWVRRLEREERLELVRRLESGSRWRAEFMAMLSLAAAIAAVGLLQSSPAVVIGAMLVAPLMTPMLGAGLGIAQGNPQLARRAAAAIVRGTVLAIVIAAAFGALGGGGVELTPELAARTAPTLGDLLVATLSGVAAAYAIARPELGEALPGVAIAAALVPPLATIGITLAGGAFDAARGAALLYATNLVAIVLAAAVVFRVVGMRPTPDAGRPWARTTVLVLLLITGALSVPLSAAVVSRLAPAGWVGAERELSPARLRALRLAVAREPGAALLSAVPSGQDEVVLLVAVPAARPEGAASRIAALAGAALREGTRARVVVVRAD